MEHGWTLERHRFDRFKVKETWGCIDGHELCDMFLLAQPL